tara:strand:- start:45 stop:326 length:282 start_codon:yes stop_codon:yes gene_type:complete
MSIIENLVGKSIEFTIGETIKICRKFVRTDGILENSYTLYTSVKKTDQLIQEQESHASIVMVHGNSENSDNFLEYAIHHALNGFECHIIDLKG